MRRRRNRIEAIEDDFMDLVPEAQAKLLAILQAIHRQRLRGDAALADLAKPEPKATWALALAREGEAKASSVGVATGDGIAGLPFGDQS